MIVTWLNGFRILPNRPRARGRPRFSTMFLPTKASATTSSSTSSPWLFSALAIADCSVFFTSSLTRFFEKVRSASALSTGLLRISAATRFSFCGLVRSIRLTAIASLSATRRGFFSLPMAYFRFAFLSAACP